MVILLVGSPLPAKCDELLNDTAELGDVDIPLDTYQHQISIVAEVAVPFHDLLVAPPGIVCSQFVLRDTTDMRSQAHVGLIEPLIAAGLLEF